ncbi:hypothetical protein PENSPDRAFT_695410, partial [Peniophora sp. CONT]
MSGLLGDSVSRTGGYNKYSERIENGVYIESTSQKKWYPYPNYYRTTTLLVGKEEFRTVQGIEAQKSGSASSEADQAQLLSEELEPDKRANCYFTPGVYTELSPALATYRFLGLEARTAWSRGAGKSSDVACGVRTDWVKISQPPLKMWTTQPQADFMYSKIDEYLTYQREGRLIHFWPMIYRQWCERWPDIGTPATGEEGSTTAAAEMSTTNPETATAATAEDTEASTDNGATSTTASANESTSTTPAPVEPESTTAATSSNTSSNTSAVTGTTATGSASAGTGATSTAVVRRGPPSLLDRIKQWFSNRRGARSEIPTRKRTTLSLNGSHTCKPLVHQVYQRLYLDKIKTVVAERYALHVHTVPAGQRPQPLIAFRNAIAKELLENESQEVRDHVYDEWKNSKGRITNAPTVKRELKDEELSDAEKHQMQLGYYEHNIGNLKATLQTVLRDIYLQTGWIMHIQGGGRRPGRGGAVQCISAHTRLPDGRNFANYNGEYMEDIQKPFGDWIMSLFPPKEQAHYDLTNPGALLGTKDDSRSIIDQEKQGDIIDGVEHLETIVVDAFPANKDTDDSATTATKRPKPRPVKKSTKKVVTPAPSLAKAASSSSSALAYRKPAQKPEHDDPDIASDEDDIWQNVDYDMLDKEPETPPEQAQKPVNANEARGTPYEQAARERAEKNRKLLLDITARARAQLGMPSSNKTPQLPPPVEVEPSDRVTRTSSRATSVASSRAPSSTRSESDFPSDFDALEFDEDKDAIATYKVIAENIDSEVMPAWDSVIDKAKTLERVLGYPASS